MKIITIPYINSKGEFTDYFYDFANDNKIVKAGTILDVPEERAKQLMGDNELNIVFAKEYISNEIELPKCLEDMTRDELFDLANELGLKVPKNTKNETLIKKIADKKINEKQNS